MKWYPGMSRAHYNEDFARAVMSAWLSSRKTFTFAHTRYTTSSYISNVLDDIRNQRYKTIKLKMLKKAC